MVRSHTNPFEVGDIVRLIERPDFSPLATECAVMFGVALPNVGDVGEVMSFYQTQEPNSVETCVVEFGKARVLLRPTQIAFHNGCEALDAVVAAWGAR